MKATRFRPFENNFLGLSKVECQMVRSAVASAVLDDFVFYESTRVLFLSRLSIKETRKLPGERDNERTMPGARRRGRPYTTCMGGQHQTWT